MVANSCVLSEPHKQQGYGRTRGSEQTQVMGSVELLVVVEGSVEAQSVSVIYPPCPQVVPRHVPGVHIGQLRMSLHHANLLAASPAEVCLTSSLALYPVDTRIYRWAHLCFCPGTTHPTSSHPG